MNEDKELEVYKGKSDGMVKMVESTKVTNESESKEIADKIKNIKLLKTAIKAKMDKSIIPAKAVIEEAKSTYMPMIEKCEWAERELKKKFTDYTLAEEEKRIEKEIKIAERVERGTMKTETAIRKIEEMPEAKRTVKSEEGATISVKKVPIAVIRDTSKIPDEFWEINIPKVNKEALRRHKENLEQIPGVEIEYRVDTSIR